MANIEINVAENGTTTLATAGKYCDRNIDVVVEVAGGGGGGIDESLLNITGSCKYKFAFDNWDNFIEIYGDKITTSGLTNTRYMFSECKNLTEVPFILNYGSIDTDGAAATCQQSSIKKFAGLNGNNFASQYSSYFNFCTELEEIGPLKNMLPSAINSMFRDCRKLRYAPNFEGFDVTRLASSGYNQAGSIFRGCYSLRQIPEDFLSKLVGIWTASSYHVYSNIVRDCWALDEVVGLGVNGTQVVTAVLFDNSFTNCWRVKEIKFTPGMSANWKSQIIDLTTCGFASSTSNITGYNSGITADKEVIDDATYQALKNDADWFTCYIPYSRYNHDSAVNTINSLPDTSAYLASAGGTNTIKFKGEAGSSTDGGAINTLTEAEIAVAAAKGWTVSLV